MTSIRNSKLTIFNMPHFLTELCFSHKKLDIMVLRSNFFCCVEKERDNQTAVSSPSVRATRFSSRVTLFDQTDEFDSNSEFLNKLGNVDTQ